MAVKCIDRGSITGPVRGSNVLFFSYSSRLPHRAEQTEKKHSFARIFTWLEWRQGRFAALRATHTFRIVLEQMRVGKE